MDCVRHADSLEPLTKRFAATSMVLADKSNMTQSDVGCAGNYALVTRTVQASAEDTVDLPPRAVTIPFDGCDLS